MTFIHFLWLFEGFLVCLCVVLLIIASKLPK